MNPLPRIQVDHIGPALLHEWVASLPTLGGVLFGLIELPYSATKVTGNLADVIAELRNGRE